MLGETDERIVGIVALDTFPVVESDGFSSPFVEGITLGVVDAFPAACDDGSSPWAMSSPTTEGIGFVPLGTVEGTKVGSEEFPDGCKTVPLLG